MSEENITTPKGFMDRLLGWIGLADSKMDKIQSGVEALASAHKDNAQLKSDLDTAKQTIRTLETEVKQLTADLAAANKRATDAEASAKVAKEEASKVASQKAAEITAGQGQPAIEVKATETPAKVKPAASKLTGLERAIAAHAASYESAK